MLSSTQMWADETSCLWPVKCGAVRIQTESTSSKYSTVRQNTDETIREYSTFTKAHMQQLLPDSNGRNASEHAQVRRKSESCICEGNINSLRKKGEQSKRSFVHAHSRRVITITPNKYMTWDIIPTLSGGAWNIDETASKSSENTRKEGAEKQIVRNGFSMELNYMLELSIILGTVHNYLRYTSAMRPSSS